MMLTFIIKCIYFAMPAYIASTAPIFAKNILKERFSAPMDFNKKFVDGKPFLGRSKTFRGLIAGILVGALISYIQYQLYAFPFFQALSFYDYSNWLSFGILLGLGALMGDMIESFIKRRINLKPGDKFVPWDQIDYTIGALIFVMPIYQVDLIQALIIIVSGFMLQIFSSHFAFYTGIRNEKW